MKEKITYGSTIHSDDTVTRRTRFDCNSLKEFKSFWQNRLTHTSNNENASWTANIELLKNEYICPIRKPSKSGRTND